MLFGKVCIIGLFCTVGKMAVGGLKKGQFKKKKWKLASAVAAGPCKH